MPLLNVILSNMSIDRKMRLRNITSKAGFWSSNKSGQKKQIASKQYCWRYTNLSEKLTVSYTTPVSTLILQSNGKRDPGRERQRSGTFLQSLCGEIFTDLNLQVYDDVDNYNYEK